MMTPDILCIGSVLWDVVGRHAGRMGFGDDRPGKISRVPGGVAMNVAMALKSHGLTPAILTAIGTDPEGEELMASCARLGVLTDHVCRFTHLPTDRYIAVEATNGLVAAIADAQSLEAAGGAILAPLRGGALSGWAGMIALDGNLTYALIEEIAHGPEFAGADLRVAPASPGKADRLAPLLSHPRATLYVNLEEAGILMHHTFTSSAEASHALLSRGLRRAVVTDGANPTAIRSRNSFVEATPPAVPVARVTGAGDTFMAAHIAAEASGHDGQPALQKALEATAAYISTSGAAAS